ncbi:aminotransferase class V-fold PLP-dependent enzyme [Sporosalibacterium faouarense]|uniref:aminotransferase class V-fold PLP-dependent enzyme n=1 Tax=Sporosalibacterium faouarense TaxID=516123 RepID=UPI00192B0D21|nr:aminotransferase class V-fold PLP-dependent enzyme [Sporosalibacterium faouarense]
MRIYMDNAATTFPKAPGVGEAVKSYIDNIGVNVKRGTYSTAFSAGETVLETREMICNLFNFHNTDNVVFTMNITQSMNFLIKEILKSGDHCIVSSMEHNAVMRPLSQLVNKKVEFSRVKCDKFGRLDPKDIKKHIKYNTRAVIMTHASNVCGTILPLYQIGKVCKDENLLFIVDSAQTAGVCDIDFNDMNADAIAFTGHKGLLGPQGTGGFILSEKLSKTIESLICGGTGSDSKSEYQPEYMPDKFEPGTMNLPGIFGLHRALKYISEIGIENIRNEELSLASRFLEGVLNMKNISIAGLSTIQGRTAVVSLDFGKKDNGEVSYLLDKDYGIMTRCGLHCAPSAHKTLGTFPHGTVRFSFSHYNTDKEVNYVLESIHKISKRRGIE